MLRVSFNLAWIQKKCLQLAGKKLYGFQTHIMMLKATKHLHVHVHITSYYNYIAASTSLWPSRRCNGFLRFGSCFSNNLGSSLDLSRHNPWDTPWYCDVWKWRHDYCESKTHHLVTISSILNCLKTCFNAVLISAQNSSQPQHNKQHEDFLTKRMTRLASTWIYQYPFEELVQIQYSSTQKQNQLLMATSYEESLEIQPWSFCAQSPCTLCISRRSEWPDPTWKPQSRKLERVEHFIMVSQKMPKCHRTKIGWTKSMRF